MDFYASATAAEVIDVIRGAAVVWAVGGSRLLTSEVLGKLPGYRMVLRSGSGRDSIIGLSPVCVSFRQCNRMQF